MFLERYGRKELQWCNHSDVILTIKANRVTLRDALKIFVLTI